MLPHGVCFGRSVVRGALHAHCTRCAVRARWSQTSVSRPGRRRMTTNWAAWALPTLALTLGMSVALRRPRAALADRMDRVSRPSDLRDAELLYQEKRFDVSEPVRLSTRLDRAYRMPSGLVVLLELKTRSVNRAFPSDVIQLSAFPGDWIHDWGRPFTKGDHAPGALSAQLPAPRSTQLARRGQSSGCGRPWEASADLSIFAGRTRLSPASPRGTSTSSGRVMSDELRVTSLEKSYSDAPVLNSSLVIRHSSLRPMRYLAPRTGGPEQGRRPLFGCATTG